jgi:hypothetical protein
LGANCSSGIIIARRYSNLTSELRMERIAVRLSSGGNSARSVLAMWYGVFLAE